MVLWVLRNSQSCVTIAMVTTHNHSITQYISPTFPLCAHTHHTPLTTGEHWSFFFYPSSFAFSRMSYKWGPMVYNTMSLTSFTRHNVFFFHSSFCYCCSFFFIAEISSVVTVYLSSYSFKDILIISSFDSYE